MEISIFWIIIFIIISSFIYYAILETAVRRGIDASETHELIKEMLENQKKKDEDESI